jgi:hypothetical protein
MRRLHLKPVHHRVLESLYLSSRSAILEEFLRRDAQIYIFAGAVRDAVALLYEGRGDGVPRDFDIGIAGVGKEDFNYVIGTYGIRNRHGGFVLQERDLPSWDVWRLEDSIGLRKTGTSFSVENVLKSFNLDCNAIALDMGTGTFIDAGAVESIRRMRLDFVERAINHSHPTFAAKALLAQMRFGYSISVPMERFINRHLDEGSLVHESLKSFPALSVIPYNNASQGRVIPA